LSRRRIRLRMRSALRFMSAAIDATGNVIETHNSARDFKEW
jgi:hypothetical protein